MANKKPDKKQGSLSVIIVGCGKVGHTLTEELVREGHDVTIVDTNRHVIESTTEVFDVMGIQGSGTGLSVLQDAGVAEADMIIAVTGSDELNLLCCTMGKKENRNIAAVARVRNPEYADELVYLRQQLGLSLIINPELEAAREIVRLLSHPQALSVSSFCKGAAELVTFKIPHANILDGKSIMQLEGIFNFGYLVCAVERNGEVTIPGGSFVLHEGDDITILARTRDGRNIFKSIGMEDAAARSCLIIGGGKATYYLAKQLLHQKMMVRIIERSRERSEALSALLPEATVIIGDGSDEGVLREAGIDSVDAFIPLTGIDEENILLTLFAQRFPALKTITKINRITFNDVIDKLDLGSVVYPKHITSETITAYVRARQNTIGNNVETMYHLFGDQVEALEFNIDHDSPVIGVPLMQLKKKDNLLIASISRKGKVIFPRGQDSIQEGDTVIIVTKHAGFCDISDILA